VILLAGVALVSYFALGLWSPWKDSDHPGRWLILAAGCAFAFLWFAAPLFR
jgi:hypothetical protein